MPKEMRAKQFNPFDALKGLQEALRLKEYEHERIAMGDLSEERIAEISTVIGSLEKNDSVKVLYFKDGHNFELIGKSKVDCNEQIIEIGDKIIKFDEITFIQKEHL